MVAPHKQSLKKKRAESLTINRITDQKTEDIFKPHELNLPKRHYKQKQTTSKRDKTAYMKPGSRRASHPEYITVLHHHHHLPGCDGTKIDYKPEINPPAIFAAVTKRVKEGQGGEIHQEKSGGR